MKKELKVALVGMGTMGNNHARILSSLPGVQLVSIVDLAASSDSDYNGIEIRNDLSSLTRMNLDYAVVATPTATHQKVACGLIENGIAVLIEKPIAHTREAAEAIVKEAIKQNVVCGVGHIERFNSALQKAKTMIGEGFLGEIYQITTRRQGPFPSRIADVGVVKDLATHDIDLTAWLVDSEYKNVSAKVKFIAGRAHEDSVSIVGELKNQVMVTHLVNWLTPYKERQTLITGERGSLIVDTLSSELTYHANGSTKVANEMLAHFNGVSQGDVINYAFDKPEPLRVEHENFRDRVLGKGGQCVTLEEGLKTLSTADAVLLSASKNQVINL